MNPRLFQLVLLGIAATVVVVSGVLMRVVLMTPEGGDQAAYVDAYSLHGVWATFGLALPLPFVLVTRAFAAWSRRLEVAAACVAAVALVCLGIGLWRAGDARAALVGVPLALLGALLQAVAALGAAWSARGGARLAERLAAGTLAVATLGLLVWGVPAVIEVVRALTTEPHEPTPGLAVLVELGLPLIAGSVGLALTWPLVFDRRALVKASGVILVVLFVAAAIARLSPADLHLADSYATVAASHGLLGGGVVVALLRWALLPKAPRAAAILALVMVLTCVAACALELTLGARGMPRRYASYLEDFQSLHVLVGLSWMACLATALVLILVAARAHHGRGGRRRLQLTPAVAVNEGVKVDVAWGAGGGCGCGCGCARAPGSPTPNPQPPTRTRTRLPRPAPRPRPRLRLPREE